MPLILPRKLRALVEAYVASGRRDLEKGGYFIGRENVIVGFLPIPNASKEDNARTYSLGNRIEIAKEYAVMLRGEVVGDLHSHPNGTIPSEQDTRYVSGLPWNFHVILSDRKESFDWYCVDRNFVGIPIVESDAELEGIMELVAGELSMNDLGRLFLTPGGELLSTKKDGLRFVSVDSDSTRVWVWGKEKGKRWDDDRTMARAKRELGMSYPRIRTAFQKLGWLD